MKRIFTAATAVAAVALAGTTLARATTFPALTTIYAASGVFDDDHDQTIAGGLVTVVNCSNMSGQTASVRYVFRYASGQIAGIGTLLLANLAAQTIATQGAIAHFNPVKLPTHLIFGGTLQVLSTQSAIYCSAMLVDAVGSEGPSGVALHMVRFNPHPGTVE